MSLTIRLPKIDKLLQMGLFLMTLKVFAGYSEVIYYNDSIDFIMTILCVVLFTVVILKEHYSFKVLLLYAAVTAAGLYSVIRTGQYGFLITIMTCMAIRDEKFDDILYHIYIYEMILFILNGIIVLFSTLLTNEYLSMTINGIVRYRFGFSHPNTFSIYYFGLVIMWVWINYQRIHMKNILAIYLLSLLVFYFTYTRTLLIDATALCLLLVFVQKSSHIIEKCIQFISRFSAIICAAFMFFLIATYQSGNVLAIFMDMLLSSRVKLGSYAYEHIGITWFGQPTVKNVQWDSFWGLTGHTYDCTYTLLAMEYGMIWLILICFCFYKLSQKKDMRICIFVIIWSLYAMTEVHPLNGYISFPILMISQLLPCGAKKSDEIKMEVE